MNKEKQEILKKILRFVPFLIISVVFMFTIIELVSIKVFVITMGLCGLLLWIIIVLSGDQR